MSNTNELTVDVRGSLCPKPVIETKKVSDANPDAVITTIVDNEVSRDNVEKFGKSRGYGVAITFWVCMVEADVKPSKIYFINSSVKMVTKDSVHLENIKKLADLGVEIAACGICLDYFGVKEELGVGSITNMYAITDSILGENIVKL